MVILNLFALRARDPNALAQSTDPVGPENDGHIRAWARSPDVVVAWGNGGALNGRQNSVLAMLGEVSCLGMTKTSAPRHPLYVGGASVPVPFDLKSGQN